MNCNQFKKEKKTWLIWSAHVKCTRDRRNLKLNFTCFISIVRKFDLSFDFLPSNDNSNESTLKPKVVLFKKSKHNAIENQKLKKKAFFFYFFFWRLPVKSNFHQINKKSRATSARVKFVYFLKRRRKVLLKQISYQSNLFICFFCKAKNEKQRREEKRKKKTKTNSILSSSFCFWICFSNLDQLQIDFQVLLEKKRRERERKNNSDYKMFFVLFLFVCKQPEIVFLFLI